MQVADLFDLAVTKAAFLHPKCNGKFVPCDKCGTSHYRSKKGLERRIPKRLQPHSGMWLCSRKCMSSVTGNTSIQFACATCGKSNTRFKSLVRGKKNNFCNRECCAAFGKSSVRCMWPGCSFDVVVGTSTIKNRHGKTVHVFNTVFKKRGTRWSKSVFCPSHEDKIKFYLGRDGYRSTSGRARLLSNPEYEYDSRATSGTFLRAVVFERAFASCEKCSVALDWNAPSKTWEIDHVVPVYRGGRTKLSNLQLLCSGCHREKTALEKSEVAKKRWAGQLDKGTRWMTHYEKDRMIESLLAQLGEQQPPFRKSD